MIPILTPEQSAAWDTSAADAGIELATLMETAGRAVAAVIAARYPVRLGDGLLVAAGPGHNGGDGWVVARALHRVGVPVWVTAIPGEGAPLRERMARLGAKRWGARGGSRRPLAQGGAAGGRPARDRCLRAAPASHGAAARAHARSRAARSSRWTVPPGWTSGPVPCTARRGRSSPSPSADSAGGTSSPGTRWETWSWWTSATRRRDPGCRRWSATSMRPDGCGASASGTTRAVGAGWSSWAAMPG